MKNDVQVQPGFVAPGADVMALVQEVGQTLRSMLKNEQIASDLAKSEKVATSEGQTIKEGGKKGSGEHVATSEGQTLKAERSPTETSSSGGGKLPVKKGSPSYSESSESSMSKASPSADEGAPGSEPSPSAGGDAPPPAGDTGAPEAPGDPAADGEAPAAVSGPSQAELVQMYAALPPEDLQMHIEAATQALQGQSGGAAGSPPPAAPSAPPMGAPSMPPPSAPPMGMGKSEPDYMAELKKTQDQVAAVAEAVAAIVTMPQRKAVTGLTFVPFQKSEAEVKSKRPSFESLRTNPKALHAELVKMTAQDSGLKKSDRDIITDFYMHRINVDELADLFTGKK